MEIKLLTPGYKKDENFYHAFQKGKLWESEYISDQSVWIPDEIPDFPIYFPFKKGENHNAEFLTAIEAIDNTILHLDRDYYMDELFWHSVLCLYKRDYLISLYPSIMESYKDFTNMVIKPFDWQNYIYKAILIAQYVADERPFEKMKYYQIIFDNMDMFNYIIKYEIFRNSTFLINVMDIITDNHLESKLKAKIKNRPDLGEDERYGRRVILELNRSYPVIMSPMLSEKELEKHFLRFLSYYTEDQTPVVQYENVEVEKTESVEESMTYMETAVANEEVAIEEKMSTAEEEQVEVEEEPLENNMLSLYVQWLKEFGFLTTVIEQYIEKMKEISNWYRQEYSVDFYTIRDIEEFKKIEEKLRKRRNTVKYRTAIKYYVRFMDEKNYLLKEQEADKNKETQQGKVESSVENTLSGEKTEADILLLFGHWLRKNDFSERMREQYIEKLREVNKRCKEENGYDLYGMRDVEKIRVMQEKLFEKSSSLKHRLAIKYYIEFLKQIKNTESLLKEPAEEVGSCKLEVSEKQGGEQQTKETQISEQQNGELQSTLEDPIIDSKRTAEIMDQFIEWLKNDGCINYAIKRYTDNMKLMETYAVQNIKTSFISMDESRMRQIYEKFPDRLHKGMYRTTLNYFYQFLNENKNI